ncbi:MAG: hypothetical protein AAF657_20700, partial [Acidobacteriota bacterium]
MVSITLPDESTVDEVDIFLLFDDTGSFAGLVPQVQNLFNDIVDQLQAQLPSADLAFGVGRFEDFGGPADDFSFEADVGRPFVLSQALLRTTNPEFETAIAEGLARSAPGSGGDGPESAIEALFQVATGNGFDGDGDGSTLGSGPAGDPLTQTAPGSSGDVPAFSSHVGLADGSIGGVGWRPDALRLVLLATDICSVAPFDAGSG